VEDERGQAFDETFLLGGRAASVGRLGHRLGWAVLATARTIRELRPIEDTRGVLSRACADDRHVFGMVAFKEEGSKR
jgi:hypothetical protein